MRLLTSPLLPLATLAAAQDSVVSLFLQVNPSIGLVGSIAGQDPTATTYVVECNASAAAQAVSYYHRNPGYIDSAINIETATSYISGNIDNPYCPYASPCTVVQGVSTVQSYATYSVLPTVVAGKCVFRGSTSAVCTVVEGPNIFDTSSLSYTFTQTWNSTDITFNQVTLTAGPSSASSPSPVSASTTAAATQVNGGTSSSAKSQSTNVAAVQGSAAFGAGILGVLGVAVAGAII